MFHVPGPTNFGDPIKAISDLTANWADTLTGGATRQIREGLGYDDAVDYDSKYSKTGVDIGEIHLLLIGLAGGGGLPRFGGGGLIRGGAEALPGAMRPGGVGIASQRQISGAALRQAVDKSWKSKISGTAQKTGTDGHRFRVYREAIAEAKKPNVQAVHLDHGYNRGLGLKPKTITPNRRPDVLSVYKDKTVARIEVQSKTDIPSVLRSRNAALDTLLRALGFRPLPPRVVVPTR
jgi:hypothetical protein